MCSHSEIVVRKRHNTRGADKFLARPGRKQDRKHVRDARDFNNIEARAVIKFLFLQGKAPKGIHAILTETLAFFLPGWAKDLSAPTLYYVMRNNNISVVFDFPQVARYLIHNYKFYQTDYKCFQRLLLNTDIF